MKVLKYAALAVLFFASIAATAATVRSAVWRKAGGFAGRSDGIYQHYYSGATHVVVNGEPEMAIGKGFYEDFTAYGDGDHFHYQSDFTAFDGSANVLNYLILPSGNKFTEVCTGGTQTAGVDMDAGSLDISGDQTNNDALYVGWGIRGAGGAPFVVGEDPAFYTCATFAIADVSGSDAVLVGFHNMNGTGAAAQSSAFDSELSIGSVSGDIKIRSEDDGTGHTDTDTTLKYGDAGTAKRYCVNISAAGVATFTVDGVAPPTTKAYTWDDGDKLSPFLYVLQDSDLSGEIDLTYWEAGYGSR